MMSSSLHRLHALLIEDEERQRQEKIEKATRQSDLMPLQEKIDKVLTTTLIPSPTAWIRPITSNLYRCPLSAPQTVLASWNSLPKTIQSKLTPPSDEKIGVVEVPLSFMIPTNTETTGKTTSSLQKRPLGGNLTNKLKEYTRGAPGQIKPFQPGGIDDTIKGTSDEYLSAQEVQQAQQVLEMGSEASWRNGTILTAPPAAEFEIGLSWIAIHSDVVPKGIDNRTQLSIEETRKEFNTITADDYDNEVSTVKTQQYRPVMTSKMWERSFFDDDSLFGESSQDEDSVDDESDKTEIFTENHTDDDSTFVDSTKTYHISETVETPTQTNEIDDLLAQLLISDMPKKRKIGVSNNPLELAQEHAEMAQDTGRKSWAVTQLLPIEDFNTLIPNPALTFPFTLDDFQQQAVARLERSESIFVAAHTSAGKTVCAEYAVALCRQHCTRAIYTSPIKALSNQKFRDFSKKFGAENVGLVTGDLQLNVDDSTCLIMTTEILRSMLYRGADLIRDIEWVIFDEVHYVNDSERGVVWEEVIIMLPQYVNLIFLSATTPNTIEFSDWIGRTKRKPVHVIRTNYRPVPLSHFLWAGLKLHKIMEGKSGFLEKGYKGATKALQPSKNDMEKGKEKGKSSGGSRPTFGSKHIAWQQQGLKNDWISLVRFLDKEGLTPSVVFSFSKKKCEEIANMLRSLDLNTATERSAIQGFTMQTIARLSPNDATLPQVQLVCEMVKRGLGVVSLTMS